MGCGEYALGIQRVNHITGKKNTASRFHAHIRTAVSQLGQKERRKDEGRALLSPTPEITRERTRQY